MTLRKRIGWWLYSDAPLPWAIKWRLRPHLWKWLIKEWP